MSTILPTPKLFEESSEKYTFPARICADCAEFSPMLDAFAASMERIHDVCPEIAPGGIAFVKDPSVRPGGYTVTCGEDGIRAAASDAEGIGYAMATLLQLVTVSRSSVVINGAKIDDYPDKGYRAIMVDLGREWHPFDKLLRYVELCFFYKIRYLHLHFCDSKLFTMPTEAFPKMNVPGTYYTREQIAELNAYAAARNVVLIPEFECPGHAQQMCRAYPEVFSDSYEDGTPHPQSDIICAGSEAAWEGTKTLLRELIALFPDAPYIHIGGDEANLSHWEKCPVCARYMAEHGIADVHELYSDYVARATDFVLAEGKIPMVWEGFPKKGAEKISRDVIVFAWESMYHMAYDLLDEGFKIINASWQPLYIVPDYQRRWGAPEILRWNVYNWQNWNPKAEAYLNPITVAPTENVLGAMLCAWEQTYEEEIAFVIENLIAMCERTWTVKRRLSDEAYLQAHRKLKRMTAKLIADR